MITESLHYPDGQIVMVGDIFRILTLWKILSIEENVAIMGDGEGHSTYTSRLDQQSINKRDRIALVRRAE